MTEFEKKLGIIGAGNCGNQIASKAMSMYPDLFDSIYINTSERDLAMCPDSDLQWQIGGGKLEGTGKNRAKTKEYLKEDIFKLLKDEKFINAIKNKKYVFVCASAAGGTGSGAAPVMTDILKPMFPDVNFILVGVMPSEYASVGENENARDFMKELCANLATNTVYALYDNNNATSTSPTKILDEINTEIVEDMRILSCVDNYPTPYESIDDADMESIVTTKGRIIITRIKKGLTEKNMEDVSIDDIIIKSIKQSAHVETNRDKLSGRWGIITYLTEPCNDLYNQSFAKLSDFIGTPSEKFNHNAINGGDMNMNFVHFIASGLLPPLDRINKLNDRIEIQKAEQAKQKNLLAESIEATMQESTVNRDHTKKVDSGEVNIKNIFDKY